LTIAYREYGNPDGFPVIALHGWLDNAATFEKLVSRLDLRNRRFIAMDFPGHGYSEHRPDGAMYHLLEYVVDCEAFVRSLKIRQFDIVGHSLGGVIGMLWAAVSVDSVRRLALIDSLGPFAGKASKVASGFQEALEKALNPSSGKRPLYASLEDAISARMNGIGNISREASSILVSRGLQEVEGGYSWRSDARLTHPSLIRLTEEQIEGFMNAVKAEVLCILASRGLIAHANKTMNRLHYFARVSHCILDGGHHLHLDDAVDEVARVLSPFLELP
jgi:pimeloyl-ACP methyl ester carboxylesterase